MTVSLESLRCFVEAARLLNFRAAARVVALSPAAFGQRIRQLEDDLGRELFRRTTRSVVLSGAGLDLVAYAERALAAAEDCVRVGRGEVGPAPMDLVLGTRHELGMSWILPMLDALERSRSGLTIHLYVGSGPDLVARVRGLAIDCAVTSSRVADPKLDSLPLHEERYVFVGRPELLRRVPLKSAAHARKHTLFDTTEDLPLYRYVRDIEGAIDGSAFARVVRMGTIDAIRHQALAGKGVAVLPEYFVRNDLAKRRLARILPKVRAASDCFRLVFRADDPRRGVYLQLADVMREAPLR